MANGQLGVACKFQNIYQLINDPVAINDGSNSEKNVKEIYPRELRLYEVNVSLLLTSNLEYYLPIVYGDILVLMEHTFGLRKKISSNLYKTWRKIVYMS